MRSMLEFVFIYGCYCHHEWQLKCFNPAADDPRLSVKALMKDDEEEIRRADMFRMFKTGMDIMGDADSALYAELSSMAQVYDMMYARAHNIGLLLPRSIKTKKETSNVYKQERMELLRNILSYKDCHKMDCDIVMPHMPGDANVGAAIIRIHEEGTTAHTFRAYLLINTQRMGLASSNQGETLGTP